MGGADESKERTVQKLLAQLRDSPIDNNGASESVLGTAYDFLLESSTGKSLHWFCSRASSAVIVEAAIFLLRLFAYNSPKVEKWKQTLDICLFNCADCVLGLEKAKIESRTTYFGSFLPNVLDNFWTSFGQWELQSVLTKLSAFGLTPDSAETNSTIPATVAYRMVINMAIFQDARIRSIIRRVPPSESFTSWPKDPIPPGVLALLLDEEPVVRQWALAQSSQATVIPVANNVLASPFKQIVVAIVSEGGDSSLKLSPVRDAVTFWKCLNDFIRFIHPDYLVSKGSADVRHLVVGHLHDNGPEFESILRCFILVLKRAGSNLWNGEAPEYPQVVFDSLKDNPSFIDLLQKEASATPDRSPLALTWFTEFMDSIRDRPVYPEVFAKLAEFMCEELQHERFGDSRPTFIVYAAKFFLYQYRRQSNVASDLIDIHADAFTTVLLSRSHSKPQWSNARNATRELIEFALARDPETIATGIDQLCKWLAYLSINKKMPKVDDQSARVTIRRQIWEKMYKSFQPQDLDGLRSVISVVSRASHLDLMVETGFAPILALSEGKALFHDINDSLVVVRSGFNDVVTAFVDHNVSTAALDLLKREGVVKDVVKLLFSPVDDIRNAAQTLVGHAFDVDVRVDCYRSLLTNFPTPAFDGMFEYLSTFVSYATAVTEACSLSKWLVRCFADVLEVLCASPRGLLHSPQFLQSSAEDGPATQLVKLWSSMCKAIQTIYKRTPTWAPHFTSEEMVEWMRDALIFVRELLQNRTVIEAAANTGKAPGKPGKLSAMGKKMVQDLHEFFPELTRWLRVTDMELLHQSYKLLQTLLDCFREAGMPPSKDALKKIESMIAVARKGDPNRGSRLDNARLSQLEEAIGYFEEDDDEFEIGPVTRAEKKPIKPEVVKAPKVKDEPTSRKPSTSAPKPTKPAVPKPPPKPITKPPIPPQKPTKQSLKGFSAADEEKLAAASKLPTFRKTVQPAGQTKSREATKSVPSSDSDDSSDEDEDAEESQRTTLAQLAKFQKSPKIKKKQPERRQIMTLDIPMERNPMAERIRAREEARRTTLRLRPDVSPLHKELLSWDYEHTGPYPPGRKLNLAHIPNKFSDFDHYRRVFEPLLLLECWSQLLQSKDEKLDFVQGKLAARQYAGEFSDIDVTIAGGTKKDWYLTENDVVLLRHMDGQTSVLGKTTNYRTLPTETQVTVRCLVKPPSDPLQLNSTWRIAKVLSLSTLHREFGALVALQAYDSFQQILHPDLSPIPTIDSKVIQQMMEKHRVNEPQAVAISASLKTQGFSLIQGPPGTGKTSTICGLVAACLSGGSAPVAIVAGKAPPKPSSPKILICAPSNAAIDEIVGRLKDGVRGLTRQEPLKVVRIGADQAINVNVKEVSLDVLVDQKLNTFGAKKSGDLGSEVAALRQELESVKQARQQKIQEVNSVQNNSARTKALDDEIRKLNSQRAALSQKLDSLRDKQKAEARTMDASRRRARQEVLQGADVICSTLSGSGHDTLEPFDFEMIIIDEAAQAIELSSLIPLKFRCSRCIMVGDPQQLPPTVLSQEACKFQYNQSLFVRLQKQRPDAVHLLSIQYRMHPDISRLPSKIFYDGKLKDGPSMAEKTERPWHSNEKFGTYRFFNVAKGLEEKSGQSLKNKSECQVAIALFDRLRKAFTRFDFTMRVGIVSMYRAQVLEIRNAFYQRFGRDIVSEVDFNTVDGFQGQEKDIIILSCVRAGPGVTSVGFLSDVRRMNVAITRAKSSLFILGNAPTLERSNEVWRGIVQDARSRNMLTDADESYFSSIVSNHAVNSTSSYSKAKRSAAPSAPNPAIPTDLITPQQLKESKEKRLSTKEKTEQTSNNVPDDASPTHMKRKRVDSLPSQEPLPPPPPSTRPPPLPIPPPSAPSSSTPPQPRPQAPPKRPKQQPNIFLPKQKNKNKRPADSNPDAGPSTNRRRL